MGPWGNRYCTRIQVSVLYYIMPNGRLDLYIRTLSHKFYNVTLYVHYVVLLAYT